jgi:hypothetical protein
MKLRRAIRRYSRYIVCTADMGGALVIVGRYVLRSPINLSLKSWKYAVRHIGLGRALLGRGWVR